MKRHLIIAILLASFYSGSAQLQDPNAIVLPSVNNKFFVSNTNSDVSKYTGTNNVTIPLFTLPSKSMSIPVSLSYGASRGIKVQEYANYVGLGWLLNASGRVTRLIRGLPDEQSHGYFGDNKSGSQIAAAAAAGTTDQNLLNSIGSGQVDGEPDIFNVKTPFFSFQFVMDENGQPVFPNNSGYKIQQDLIHNETWIITDDHGNQFYFGTTDNSRESSTTTILNQSKTFVSTWYLDKIIAYNNSDQITFDYQAGTSYSMKHYLTTRVVKKGYGIDDDGTDTKDVTNSVTFSSPKYLSHITSALGNVTFNYAFDRRDLTGGARLTSVAVYAYDKPDAVKKYVFDYTYFGDPSSDPEALRLKLEDIYLYGNSTTVTEAPIKYKTFYYETTNNLPSRSSVEFDYWGYYNVNTSGTSMVPDAVKDPVEARTKANILTAVEDASGERLEFQYELNKYYDATLGNVDIGGLRIKRVSKKLPTGEELYSDYVYDDGDFHSSAQIYDPNYKTLSREVLHHLTYLDFNGIIVIAVTTADVTISENIYHTYDLDGNFIGYSSVKVQDQNGGYEVYNYYNFNDFPDVNSNIVGYQIGSPSSLSYKRGLLKHKEIHLAGGYPVSELTNTFTGLDQPVTKKSYGITPIPTYADDLSWANVYYPHYNVYATNIENYVLTETVEKTYDQVDQTLFRQSVTDYTYAANKRLIHQAVTTDSKGHTKTRVCYYPEDANIPYVNSDEQTAINSMSAGNKTSTLVHTVESTNGTDLNTHYTYLPFVDPAGAGKTSLVNKKTFVGGDIANASVEQYQYDLSSQALISLNKLGEPFISTVYGYNGGYMKAKVKNAVNTASVSFVQTTGAGSVSLDVITSFQTDIIYVGGSGQVDVYFYGSSLNTPSALDYSLQGMQGSGFFASGRLCISNDVRHPCNGGAGNHGVITGVTAGVYALTLSASGPLGDDDWSGTLSASYSYPKLQPSGSTINEFFYEGFEEGDGLGNGNTPFAGKRNFHGAYTVPFVIPNSRLYQVDYHYLLNGQWYAASKPYQNNMVLNDGTDIDEVRVYPTDAQMTSYTYDPLVGITSEGGVRNRFTFYEYDAFGRLKIIRDNDKNILKRYDYTYQTSLTQTCPRPEIYSITIPFTNTIEASYIVPPGCTSITYSLVQNATGATVTAGTAGRVGPDITLNVPAGNQSYTMTVTSYSANCPQGVSDTKVVTLP